MMKDARSTITRRLTWTWRGAAALFLVAPMLVFGESSLASGPWIVGALVISEVWAAANLVIKHIDGSRDES